MGIIGDMHRAKKSFGQHFLHDQAVLQKIVDAAAPEAYAQVVEVGPGTGALTEHLAPRAKHLTLIEADRDLVPALAERFPQAVILQADAATTDFAALTSDAWVLVANLPYNAANAIIMNALTCPHPPECMVVMVQKEVGERLLAQPGAMSVLGVAAGLYADVERVCTVKPGAFHPPPKVDSMVVRLVPRHAVPHAEEIIRLAKAGFASRRKFLASNVAHAQLGTAEAVKTWLVGHGFTEKARAEELRVEDWVHLWNAVA